MFEIAEPAGRPFGAEAHAGGRRGSSIQRVPMEASCALTVTVSDMGRRGRGGESCRSDGAGPPRTGSSSVTNLPRLVAEQRAGGGLEGDGHHVRRLRQERTRIRAVRPRSRRRRVGRMALMAVIRGDRAGRGCAEGWRTYQSTNARPPEFLFGTVGPGQVGGRFMPCWFALHDGGGPRRWWRARPR